MPSHLIAASGVFDLYQSAAKGRGKPRHVAARIDFADAAHQVRAGTDPVRDHRQCSSGHCFVDDDAPGFSLAGEHENIGSVEICGKLGLVDETSDGPARGYQRFPDLIGQYSFTHEESSYFPRQELGCSGEIERTLARDQFSAEHHDFLTVVQIPSCQQLRPRDLRRVSEPPVIH
jgi:hypothetical protein